MCPPDIYGPGSGPGKVRSVYFPMYFEQARKLGYAFYAGGGTNTRSWVHVEDLMAVYLRVVEAAVAGGEDADWGKEVRLLPSSHSKHSLSGADGRRRDTTLPPRKKSRRPTSRRQSAS